MIDILLSTYNGSRYLRQQIDSLLRQTYPYWRLLVRDDSSTDDTVSILNEYHKQYPERIILVDEDTPNLGSTQSFGRLLDFVASDYCMFSDQDDIWKPDKIERTLQEMQRMEKLCGDNIPLLICSDAECVDEDGRMICPSFFLSQKFVDTTKSAISLLALNVVQGSTIMINHAVLDYIKPIPKYVQHDQWIAVITAHYGKVSYLHEPLLQYRQHRSNELGAKQINVSYFLKKMMNAKKQMKIYMAFYQNLPFRPNIIAWGWKKSILTAYRLMNSGNMEYHQHSKIAYTGGVNLKSQSSR